MNVILFYDITENNRLNKIRKICTKYLLHIQFSVFQGELENYELIKLKKEIEKTMNKKEDSIIIFKFKYMQEENKEVLGTEKK